jgi:hypothetical protein
MAIYDPPMCCPTGVCGPSVDPELIRVATVLNNLKKRGVFVERYGLSNTPRAFMVSAKISALLRKQGPGALPAIVVDGEIVKTGKYPTNEEFAAWLGVPAGYISAEKK